MIVYQSGKKQLDLVIRSEKKQVDLVIRPEMKQLVLVLRPEKKQLTKTYIAVYSGCSELRTSLQFCGLNSVPFGNLVPKIAASKGISNLLCVLVAKSL